MCQLGSRGIARNETPYCVEASAWAWLKPQRLAWMIVIIRGVRGLEGVKVIQVAVFFCFFFSFLFFQIPFLAVMKTWPQSGHMCRQLLTAKTEKKVQLSRKKQPNYMYTQLIHPWEIEIFSQMIRVIPNCCHRHERTHIHTRPHILNLL